MCAVFLLAASGACEENQGINAGRTGSTIEPSATEDFLDSYDSYEDDYHDVPASDYEYVDDFEFEPDGNSGYCTQDCSGHDAGYEWADENGITDPYDCGGNSQSFIEGCEAYAEEYQEEYGYYEDEYPDEDCVDYLDC